MMPATDAAIVSALAPGSVAVTAMVGKSTRGSAETGSSRKPTTPKAMIESVISVVITGRRIHSSDSVIASRSGLAGPGFHPGAVRQQQLPVDHDVLASGQPFQNYRCTLKGTLDLDRLNSCRALFPHEDEVAALAALHGNRRHHHRILDANEDRKSTR